MDDTERRGKACFSSFSFCGAMDGEECCAGYREGKVSFIPFIIEKRMCVRDIEEKNLVLHPEETRLEGIGKEKLALYPEEAWL